MNSKDGGDDRDDAERTINKKQHVLGYKLALPSVVNDSIASYLFPHTSVPHYVWINQSGKVIAITSSEEINEAAIEEAIASGMVSLPTKKDVKIKLREPLFINGNGGKEPTYIYRSILSGFIDGAVSSYGFTYERNR